MSTKHYYFVSGLDPQGDKFAGSCVAGDIINAINLFRNICHSVHEIKMGVQAPADHEECITVLNGIRYTTIIARSGRNRNALQIAEDLFHVKMVPCNRCIFRREIPDRDEDGRPIARVECDKQDGNMWGAVMGGPGFCSEGILEVDDDE